MAVLFSARDLEVKYHTHDGIVTALRDVSFDVQEGEILGVVGESGCGKSTMAGAVMRLLPTNGEITRGQLLFKGQDLRGLEEEEMRRLRGTQISMIFQDALASLSPLFSIETQMVDELKAHNPRSGTRELRQQAVRMMDRVGIADPALQIKGYPHQFSGGMRQRIMIAKALLSHPALLIADEPTSALDVTLEAQILDLIRGLRDELGTAILYITHDLGVVAQLCDRLIVMYAGNVVEAGEIHDIFDDPQHPYTRALMRSHPSRSRGAERLVAIPGRVPSLRDLPQGCKFAPRCLVAQPICRTVEPGNLQVGRQTILCHLPPGWAPGMDPQAAASAAAQPPARAMGDVLLETIELRTHFADRIGFFGHLTGLKAGSVRAVDGVGVSLLRGETLGVVGESGSGKTTLGRTILRLETPTSGQIELDGREITRLNQRALRPMRARMQMIFQDPTSSLSPRLTVSALLLEPFRIHGIEVDEQRKVEELLAMVGLAAEQADKYPHQLSGGQARRVGIARALALNPDLLVADEPTAGLDVSVAAGILNLMKDLRERLNLTYLIITHNLDVVNFIADRIAVMYLGKVVELATAADVFERPKHPYTEALISAISLPDPHLRDRRQRIVLQGEIPSPRHPPSGCVFHPRCRYATARCALEAPALRPVDGGSRLSACFYPEHVLGQEAGG